MTVRNRTRIINGDIQKSDFGPVTFFRKREPLSDSFLSAGTVTFLPGTLAYCADESSSWLIYLWVGLSGILNYLLALGLAYGIILIMRA